MNAPSGPSSAISSAQPRPARPSGRSFWPRVLNAALWLVFCAMTGTGLLLAFRLPPGSRGGRGLSALGLTRHDWGDIHTWLSCAFILLIVVHLILHWRWFWQVAARRHSLPLLAGFGAGLALIAALALLPVERSSQARDDGRRGGQTGRDHSAEDHEDGPRGGGRGWRGGRAAEDGFESGY